MIRGRGEFRFLSMVWQELLGLFVLWVMWLVGAAIATVRDLFGIQTRLFSNSDQLSLEIVSSPCGQIYPHSALNSLHVECSTPCLHLRGWAG